MGYEAFVVTESSRKKLLTMFPPKFPNVIGHHVTLNFGVPARDSSVYGEFEVLHVVGYSVGDGIEVLVVQHQGSTKRPDGKTYHITWSIDRSKGVKPVHSNNQLEQHGFEPITPVMITATLQYLE